MEIKLFGKSIFEWSKNKPLYLVSEAQSSTKSSKYIPDFHKAGSNDWSDGSTISSFVVMETSTPGRQIAVPKGEVEKPKPPDEITPKGLYELKTLNDEAFKLNADPAYIDQQIEDFKEKLKLISMEEYDMRRGVEEIGSILMRLENRKKYPEHKDFFDDYAYTTTTKINEVLKKHANLQLGQIAQFIADMPKEATKAMREYTNHCDDLCGKNPVFYIIADKKDFKNTQSRRDPILLAQSPFGHVWQILGAWDKEMLFLEEL